MAKRVNERAASVLAAALSRDVDSDYETDAKGRRVKVRNVGREDTLACFAGKRGEHEDEVLAHVGPSVLSYFVKQGYVRRSRADASMILVTKAGAKQWKLPYANEFGPLAYFD